MYAVLMRVTTLLSRKDRMDMHVRYWGNTANAVFTQYWSSEYLDKASANNVYSKFESCARDLKGSKLIQGLLFFCLSL